MSATILKLAEQRAPVEESRDWTLEWQRFKHRVQLTRKWWLRPHVAFQPYFVIATTRSGSNLLLSYLKQQPEVSALSEVLCPKLAIGPSEHCLPPAKAIKHLRYSLQGARGAARGAKLMMHQMANCQLTMDGLYEAFPQAKFIILYRQSMGEQFVSQETSMATGQFLVYAGEHRREARVRIDAAKLRSYCEGMRNGYREAISRPWLRGRAVLLSYEELTAEPDYWMGQHIWPLLGVTPVPAETQLVKQNTQPLSQLVTNYAQVAALLHSPLCQQYHAWPWQRNHSLQKQTRRRAA